MEIESFTNRHHAAFQKPPLAACGEFVRAIGDDLNIDASMLDGLMFCDEDTTTEFNQALGQADDSDDEVFFGAVTEVEARKAAEFVRRRTLGGRESDPPKPGTPLASNSASSTGNVTAVASNLSASREIRFQQQFIEESPQSRKAMFQATTPSRRPTPATPLEMERTLSGSKFYPRSPSGKATQSATLSTMYDQKSPIRPTSKKEVAASPYVASKENHAGGGTGGIPRRPFSTINTNLKQEAVAATPTKLASTSVAGDVQVAAPFTQKLTFTPMKKPAIAPLAIPIFVAEDDTSPPQSTEPKPASTPISAEKSVLTDSKQLVQTMTLEEKKKRLERIREERRLLQEKLGADRSTVAAKGSSEPSVLQMANSASAAARSLMSPARTVVPVSSFASRRPVELIMPSPMGKLNPLKTQVRVYTQTAQQLVAATTASAMAAAAAAVSAKSAVDMQELELTRLTKLNTLRNSLLKGSEENALASARLNQPVRLPKVRWAEILTVEEQIPVAPIPAERRKSIIRVSEV